MAPHRAEADAVRVMRDLYAWGEIVASGLDNEGIDIGGDDRVRNAGAEATEEDASMKVGRAAKRLCQWLGDGHAWDECHGVMGELRDLVEREETARGRIGEIDDGNSDGLNLT